MLSVDLRIRGNDELGDSFRVACSKHALPKRIQDCRVPVQPAICGYDSGSRAKIGLGISLCQGRHFSH
jgi:hypothetical protein